VRQKNDRRADEEDWHEPSGSPQNSLLTAYCLTGNKGFYLIPPEPAANYKKRNGQEEPSNQPGIINHPDTGWWALSASITCPMANTRNAILAAIASGALLICIAMPTTAEEPVCNQDAMLVFDAGDGWGYGSESANTVPRIQKVRAALAKVLPGITRYRRVGLITFGPNHCNVKLELKPAENSASNIMSIVDALVPAGQTPLTAAVADAAEVLDFREKPGIIVLLTDGEETCGGNPCTLGKRLHAEANQLTVHVIGIRVKGYTWMGEQSLLDTECLAEQNGGLYIGVESEDDLVKAFQKTLGCPMLSERASP